MELFSAMLSAALQIFSLPLDLFGFSFSFWEVFLFGAVVCIIGRFLAEVFFGD